MHSTGMKPSSVSQFSIAALFVLLAAMHMSLPAIVTFDSAHYHTFLPILWGSVPFSEWDIVRGPVFPLLLFLSQLLFGFGSNGFVAFAAVWYLGTIAVALGLLRAHRNGNRLPWFLVIITLFLFATDPLIVGYYHTVLTEFVAATIFLVSTAVALAWLKLKTDVNRLGHWLATTYFVILFPLSYLLKQPYVTGAALPLCGSFILALLSASGVRERCNRAITVMLSILSLVVGIVIWENYLPPEAKAKYAGRSSEALLSTQILRGLRGIVPVTASGQRPSEEAAELAGVPLSIRRELVEIAATNTCSQLFQLRGGGEYIVYKCRTGSSTEALQFVVKNLFEFPNVTMQGYFRSYLEIIRAEEISLFGFREHGAIAYRTFKVGSDHSNVFPISNLELASLVRGYKLDRKAQPAGWLGDLPYRWFGNLSLFLFTWTLAMAPWFCGLSLLALLAATFFSISILERNRDFLTTVFVINFCATTHVFVHAFLMAIIDRYAFPVYPIVLLNLFLIVAWCVSSLDRLIPKLRLVRHSSALAK
jgi:hypothetical protein